MTAPVNTDLIAFYELAQRLDRLERAINEMAEMEKVAEGLGLEIKPPFMRLAEKLKEMKP